MFFGGPFEGALLHFPRDIYEEFISRFRTLLLSPKSVGGRTQIPANTHRRAPNYLHLKRLTVTIPPSHAPPTFKQRFDHKTEECGKNVRFTRFSREVLHRSSPAAVDDGTVQG